MARYHAGETALFTFFTLVATADLRSLLYTRCFSANLCLCLAFWAATMTSDDLLDKG